MNFQTLFPRNVKREAFWLRNYRIWSYFCLDYLFFSDILPVFPWKWAFQGQNFQFRMMMTPVVCKIKYYISLRNWCSITILFCPQVSQRLHFRNFDRILGINCFRNNHQSACSVKIFSKSFPLLYFIIFILKINFYQQSDLEGQIFTSCRD